ncbi:DUF1525 domain-containing protein [Methylocaldum sp. GT1TLB]|uniref:DUF1525 domain-containing protein n=1 Tax=Methylocaldum sp. GT1TLB TaxID=3438965 RepID=UPI003DA0F11F
MANPCGPRWSCCASPHPRFRPISGRPPWRFSPIRRFQPPALTRFGPKGFPSTSSIFPPHAGSRRSSRQDSPRTRRRPWRIARQRLEGQGSGLAAPLQAAYEGHARALSYGLTRYPAIVFDRGRAVVYGTADLGEALRYYRTWKEGTP